MSEPFLAEIRILGFDFAPRGWAACDGQILPINQNQSLYSLLGTTYGGDGRTSFGLPDLRSRTPIHPDGTIRLGNKAGEETHALNASEMPAHDHAMMANNGPGTVPVPAGAPSLAAYNTGFGPSGASEVTQPNTTLTTSGGGQAHENTQPFLGLNFAIAMQGLFPSRN